MLPGAGCSYSPLRVFISVAPALASHRILLFFSPQCYFFFSLSNENNDNCARHVRTFATVDDAKNKSKNKRSVIRMEEWRLSATLNGVVCAEALSVAPILPELRESCDWAASGRFSPRKRFLRDSVGGRKHGSRVRRLRRARLQPATVSFRAGDGKWLLTALHLWDKTTLSATYLILFS